MKMETKQITEVTLKMSGNDFKKMMNGLKSFAYGYDVTEDNKLDSGEVYTGFVEIAKESGFDWSEQ